MYGFDQSDWYYRTDHRGERLRADIPYKDLAAMLEIVTAARRANTERLEASTPRHASTKSSLASVPYLRSATSSEKLLPDPAVEHLKHALETQGPRDATKAREALEAIFAGVPIPNDSMPSVPTAPARPTRDAQRDRYLPQSFLQAPPREVQARIDAGFHFLQAWREHRGLSHRQVAEQLGCTASNVAKHESGEASSMRAKTRELFAVLYDCTIEQLTAIEAPRFEKPSPQFEKRSPKFEKPSSSLRAPQPSIEAPASIQYAPEGTFFPERVLANLASGHTIVTAWRVYRDLSIKQAAEAYGCTPSGFRQLEEGAALRRKTLEKLAQVFRCKFNQLLLPVPFRQGNRSAPQERVAA